jgi:hypothetical protein
MNILDVSGAEHFCATFGHARAGPIISPQEYSRTRLTGITLINEGTPVGDGYRDSLLRDVDRSLFFSASHYRRALDLMTISASPWAHVTLYYGSYFAARAIVGMFGSWIQAPAMRIEATASTPGKQQFSVTRRVQRLSTFNGPHRVFWDFYYIAAATLLPWVPRHLLDAVTPVSSNPVWQIDTRNSINYDTHVAVDLSSGFLGSFSHSGFPTSLPGALSTQYHVSRATVELAFWFAKQFHVRTDALSTLGISGRRSRIIRELVYGAKVPSLTRALIKGKILI